MVIPCVVYGKCTIVGMVSGLGYMYIVAVAKANDVVVS